MSQSGWIWSLTISSAENLWGFLFVPFLPRVSPSPGEWFLAVPLRFSLRIGRIHPNIRRGGKKAFGEKGEKSIPCQNSLAPHLPLSLSLCLKRGRLGRMGRALLPRASVAPSTARAAFWVNRKMTKWWQRNGCQFQVESSPPRMHSIVFSDGTFTTSLLSLQRLMIWRFDFCPSAQASTES